MMQKIEQQIQLYEKLSNPYKDIYRAFAVKTTFNGYTDLSSILSDKKKYSNKAINDTIAEALEAGIITHNSDHSMFRSLKYVVTYPFLAYVLTKLTMREKKEVLLQDRYFSFYSSFDKINPKNVTYLLCNILYDNLDTTGYRDTNILDNYNILRQLNILHYPEYVANLNKLSVRFLHSVFQSEIERCIFNIYPLSHIDDIYNILKSNVDEIKLVDFDYLLRINTYILKGRLAEAVELIIKEGEDDFETFAMLSFLNGNISETTKLFDKQIKQYKDDYADRSIMMIPDYRYNFFYFAFILSLPSSKAVPRAKKILDSFEKTNYYGFFDEHLKYILKDTIGIKENNAVYIKDIFRQGLMDTKVKALYNVAFAYMAKIQPDESMRERIFEIIVEAYNNEHYLIAYEASYAMAQWFEDDNYVKMFELIESKMSYKPFLSFILRVEDWEKSLDLMVGALGGIKKGKSDSKQSANKQRIIYTFNPYNHRFRPMLQTKGANGKWSKGRNVSIKSFQEGTAKGMTDKDLRISKYVRTYRAGGTDMYELSALVAVELIGHPLVFMDDNIEIPIELIAADLIIKVEKKKNGYTLKSEITDYNSELIIEKETNTRYKVYVIDSKIRELLRILTTNKTVIPEQGTEKLTLLLGEISKYAVVQSDLIASPEGGGISAKEMDSDSRIRIQLLPIGDGLKAELFVKPFDKAPPYAKPSIGGKVLFANIDGEQLQVTRDFDTERENYYTILENIQSLNGVDTSEDLISFENPLDSLFLLDVISEHQDISVVEWPEGESYKVTSRADFSNLKMRIKSKTNWFELDGELVIDNDTVISMQQLLGLMTKSHDRFIELNKGEFIALSEELRKRLAELSSYADNSKSGVKINKYATLALDGFFDNLEGLKADKSWKEFRKQIGSKTAIDTEIPPTLHADLRPYQEEGYKWMTRLSEMGAGACLADDMGLGKTLQTLAILLNRIDKGPSLVVCPVSIIGNWVSEAQRFAPTLNVKVLNSTSRDKTIEELTDGDVLITSYGLLQSEEDLFSKKEFGTIVLDEAHIIKNYATKTSKAIMKLTGDFRIALTGTPLQNHMGEIWNLFNFINPGLLGNLKHFTDTFIKPDDEASKKMLRKLIKPFILRRTKTAVLEELPPKTEIVKKIQLSDTEMAFYEALRRQALINIETDDGNAGAKHIKALAEITKLRQASCNPLLVDPNIKIESSKLNTFLEIVDELKDNKHRALVFSQFVSHLSIVRKELDKRGVKYQYLDGSSPIKEREQSVKKFQKGEGDLFLISLKAGGLGLNLTAADFVIHLDPWWNPAIEDQASDRAHRFGQKRPVTIYRLVAENTIEEKIIKLHSTKRDLAESLLEGTDQSAKLSFTELVELMKG